MKRTAGATVVRATVVNAAVLGCMFAFGIAGCAPVSGPAAPNTLAMAPERTVDRPLEPRVAETDAVGAILVRGLAADASGDGEALYDQAQALIRMGAHSEDGTDLADVWLRRAQALGVAPRTEVAFRGRTLGPGYRQGHINAHGHFRTHQSFNAGQRAEIVLVPIDEAPLSLDVVDDEGAAICSVAPSTRNLGCRWVPSFTGTSDINVNNDNDRDVSFYIVLN